MLGDKREEIIKEGIHSTNHAVPQSLALEQLQGIEAELAG